MNYIREYWQEIQDGLQVSKEIKNTYQHLINKLDGKVNDGFHFDKKRANKIIEFTEKFIVMPKSKSKETVKLLLWEKALFQSIFGFVDDEGLRQYQECFLLVGRKNGKSAIASIFGLYMLICDGENQPEIYYASNKLDQSKICFNCVCDMIKASKYLQQVCKIRVADVVTEFNGGRLRPLSADKNFDGINGSLIVLDENHQYADDSLYNVLVDSQAMRKQPLTLLTTTNGFLRDKFLDKKLDEYAKIIDGYSNENGYKDNRRIAFLYQLDNQQEMYSEEKWIKANPSIDAVRDREKLRADVERSKQDETKRKDILTKFFNIPQTGQFHFLTVEECDNKNTFDITKLQPRYYCGGLDLSRVNDLTSAICLMKVKDDNTFYVLNMNWIPADTLDEHIKKDRCPYDLFLKNGWLRLCNGNQIDYRDIIAWFEEIRINYNVFPYRLGYDPWSSASIVNDLKNMYGETALIPVRQGAKSLSLPLQKLKAELQNNNINYNNNQLLKTCLLNLKVTTDINGNLNTIKDRNANLRDDGACSLLNAFFVYLNNEQDYLNLI